MTVVGGVAERGEREDPKETAQPSRVARPGVRPAHRPGGQGADEEADQPRPQPLWDVAAVADYLQLPVGSIYKMTARKASVRIPHIRLGGKLRFRKTDIDRWLTLLTVSNLDTLARMRQTVAKVTHGTDT